VVPGNYLIGVGLVDLSRSIESGDVVGTLLDGLEETMRQRQLQMRERESALHRAGVDADVRFVRMMVPASLECQALFDDPTRTNRSWEQVDVSVAHDLLTPYWNSNTPPHHESVTLSPDAKQQLPVKLQQRLAKQAAESRRERLKSIRESAEERVAMIRGDAADRLWNVAHQLNEARKQLDTLQKSADPVDQRRATMNVRPRIELLEEQTHLVQRSTMLRCEGLNAVVAAASDDSPEQVALQAAMCIEVQLDLDRERTDNMTAGEADAETEATHVPSSRIVEAKQ
jgi:hypothetical protein